MNNFSETLTRLMMSRGMGDSELAEKLDVNRSTVVRWRNGIRSPKLEKLPEIAEVFKVDPKVFISSKGNEYIEDNKEDLNVLPIYSQLESSRQKKVYHYAEHQLEEQNNFVSFPVYGKTAAGTDPVTYGDNDIEHKDFSSVPSGADVALVVSGDSMYPIIHDGSIIFYKRQPNVENGEIAVIEVEGEGVTCKRVKFDYNNKKIILQSENDKYDDMVFTNDQIRILGRVLL